MNRMKMATTSKFSSIFILFTGFDSKLKATFANAPINHGCGRNIAIINEPWSRSRGRSYD